ncbi:MAG: thioredoxin family protein [Bacteroidetes bacterium]|nr:thioredoxin family protein [Bacteroidota bacterium]
MKTIIFLFIAGIAIVLMALNFPRVNFNKDAEGGINFHKGTWSEALTKAEKENKIIFLDIYATWCGPCKRLKAKTFSDKEVGGFYNPNFINVAIDGEKGEGPELARKYSVTGYPTLLFFDSKGNLIARTAGFHNAKDFLAMGEKVFKKL